MLLRGLSRALQGTAMRTDAPAEHVQAPVRSEKQPPVTLQKQPPPGIAPKYLVVNDEPIIANTLTHILNQRGYPCVAAYDGEEAIERARELHPKFILMNVFMPRVNGVEAAMRIIQEQPECRVLIFSGSKHAADLLNDAAAKGYTFPVMPSPFPPPQLLQVLLELGFKPEWG